MRMFMLVSAAALVLGARAARADQCELVSEDQAATAATLIKGNAGSYLAFCQACGDKEPSVKAAKVVEARKASGGMFTLFADGKPLDLAYTYFALPHGKWRNLGIAVACQVVNQDEFVTTSFTK